MGDGGLEPTPKSSGKTPFSETGGAESGAVGARNGAFDPDLAAIIAAWGDLPTETRQALVEAVQRQQLPKGNEPI